MGRKITVILILFGCAALTIVEFLAARREAAVVLSFPPEGQIINVQGHSVHAIVKGSGPDLVLIHGASGNARDFTFDFVDRLTKRYRVTVLDRPGLGHSSSIIRSENAIFATQGSSPSQQAEILVGAMRALNLKNSIVLGHSLGGIVALAMALDYPSDVSSLVLVSSVSNPWPGDLGWFYKLNGSLIGGAIVPPVLSAFVTNKLVKSNVAEIFAPQIAPNGYLEHIGAGLVLRRDTMRANARQVFGLKAHVKKISGRYDQLNLPVEILHGNKDTIVPFQIHSKKLVKQIENAVLTVLPGVGHMPHHTNPDVIISAIDRAATRQ